MVQSRVENQFYLVVRVLQSYDGPVLLSEVEVGSYVDYVGNNGCVEDRCDGTNVNYRNVANMGYCYYDGYTYKSNGFRVGYIKNNTSYLINFFSE